MSTLPIGLTDSELRILLDLARPLQLAERGRSMELVGERLRAHGSELGDGTVSQIARERSETSFQAADRVGGCSAADRIES